MNGSSALDQFLDPLSRCLDAESARRVLALGVSVFVQDRVDTLAERANEGLLSDDERAEHEALINAEDFVAIWPLAVTLQSPQGPNLRGIDPIAGEIFPLFDLQRDQCSILSASGDRLSRGVRRSNETGGF